METVTMVIISTVADRVRENEAVKLIRFKDGVLKLSNAYVELGKKCAIIHEAQKVKITTHCTRYNGPLGVSFRTSSCPH